MTTYSVKLTSEDWVGEKGRKHLERVVLPGLQAHGFRAEIVEGKAETDGGVWIPFGGGRCPMDFEITCFCE